ncbi:MAG: hypothetical protein JO257_09950 [Deltaproteobacteria bacterium]|nr:hypothetical protein [Deltaproteobacteria bacterium]
MRNAIVSIVLVAACSHGKHPFPLRDPMVKDNDMQPFSLPCHGEGSDQDCSPPEYVSPYIWDQVDNLVFARISRGLSLAVHGEARNVNSMDEVADSSWFTNRKPVAPNPKEPGACDENDMLPPPDKIEKGAWVIDHGKDNGATLGFRVNIEGKGKYMLKADEKGKPERGSAASVVGAAIYDALGFNTTCEQIVQVRRDMLTLKPGLKVVENSGLTHPFDEDALKEVLESSTQLGNGLVRMQASKWLPGVAVGPFRYIGTRDDDANDVVDHADRRELRGSRLVAAWLDHWDAREQNSMDVWLAVNKEKKKSSPGFFKHYILDTSDIFGEEVTLDDMSRRLGYGYEFDIKDIGKQLITFGADEEPWDRAHRVPGKEQFGYFNYPDFDPVRWRPFYPNPAFMRATERDNAWMARKIAQLSPEDIKKFVELGAWSKAENAEYIYNILIERQRKILHRYLTRISPLGDIANDNGSICATDFARLREVYPRDRFTYTVVEHGYGVDTQVHATVDDQSRMCFVPQPTNPGNVPDSDDRRRVDFTIHNGTSAKPLVIHAFDLGTRGIKVVGVTR